MPNLRGQFRFDAATHTYRVGDARVPGIHAVLRAGGVEQELLWLDAACRVRGKGVHAATLAYDLGDDVAPLPEAWQPYFDAYLSLRRQVRCRWRRLEHPRVNRRLGYASIIDRVGLVSGWPAVVEIKTGYPAAWHGAQLAGADLLLPGARLLRKRIALYLGSDGRFRVREYADPRDYVTFMESVDAYWKGAAA